MKQNGCVGAVYRFLIVCAAGWLWAGAAQAADLIRFPEEELAKETVLPKFDRPEVLLNRNVVTADKLEFALYYGMNFTEPIFNQAKFGGNVGYHWSEESALALNFASWMSGLNRQYTDSLSTTYGLDFGRAPRPEYSVWLNYELKAYYGKISFTKQSVVNTSLYPLAGVGFTKHPHKFYPGVNFGIGTKFYFNPSWALRADFKIQYQQAPSPFLEGRMVSRVSSGSPDPVPQASEFIDKWGFGTVFDLGLSFMF